MLTHYYLGLVYRVLNESNVAKEHFMASLGEAEGFELLSNFNAWVVPNTYFQLGEVHEYLNDRDKAETFYEIVADHPDAADDLEASANNRLENEIVPVEMLVNKGIHLVMINEVEKGIDTLTFVRTRLENHKRAGEGKRLAYVLYHIGKGHLKNREFQKAITAFDLSADYFEKFADKDQYGWLPPYLHFRRGDAYVELGDQKTARTEFEKALAFEDYFAEPRLRFLVNEKIGKMQ